LGADKNKNQMKKRRPRTEAIERPMCEQELKLAYINLLVKYKMVGVHLQPISEVPIFRDTKNG